jgi:hypothetical protein
MFNMFAIFLTVFLFPGSHPTYYMFAYQLSLGHPIFNGHGIVDTSIKPTYGGLFRSFHETGKIPERQSIFYLDRIPKGKSLPINII